MKTRYTAAALIDWGEGDPDSHIYKTFYGKNLAVVVKQAEKASLTNEAYLITEETYRPKYRDWEITERINYYG